MARHLLACLLLFSHSAWLAPAGTCPHAEAAADSRPACHDTSHAGTVNAVLAGPGECMECDVPACRSPSGCAAGTMASAQFQGISVDPHPARAAIADPPGWMAGDLAPPLPPPPRV